MYCQMYNILCKHIKFISCTKNNENLIFTVIFGYMCRNEKKYVYAYVLTFNIQVKKRRNNFFRRYLDFASYIFSQKKFMV